MQEIFYQLCKEKGNIFTRKDNRVNFITYMTQQWWGNPGRCEALQNCTSVGAEKLHLRALSYEVVSN